MCDNNRSRWEVNCYLLYVVVVTWPTGLLPFNLEVNWVEHVGTLHIVVNVLPCPGVILEKYLLLLGVELINVWREKGSLKQLDVIWHFTFLLQFCGTEPCYQFNALSAKWVEFLNVVWGEASLHHGGLRSEDACGVKPPSRLLASKDIEWDGTYSFCMHLCSSKNSCDHIFILVGFLFKIF